MTATSILGWLYFQLDRGAFCRENLPRNISESGTNYPRPRRAQVLGDDILKMLRLILTHPIFCAPRVSLYSLEHLQLRDSCEIALVDVNFTWSMLLST